jgi:hypothetical protein
VQIPGDFFDGHEKTRQAASHWLIEAEQTISGKEQHHVVFLDS